MPTLKPGSRRAKLQAMEPSFSIGQLARSAGVPTSTVRYYERARLLRPDGRTSGNYRVYGTAALERLRFIRAAQANGFTLEDVVALLNFRDGRTSPCTEVQDLIQKRLGDLEGRMEELRQLRVVLQSSLKMCRQTERTGKCHVVEKLKVAVAFPLPGNPKCSGAKKS